MENGIRKFQTGLKKRPTKPQPEDQEERDKSQTKPKTEQKRRNDITNSNSGRKVATRTNTRGHNEEAGRHGIQANVLSTSRSPNTTKATTIKPGSPSTGNPDSISLGQSHPLDPNPDPNIISRNKEVPTNREQNQSKNNQLKIGTWNVRRGEKMKSSSFNNPKT